MAPDFIPVNEEAVVQVALFARNRRGEFESAEFGVAIRDVPIGKVC